MTRKPFNPDAAALPIDMSSWPEGTTPEQALEWLREHLPEWSRHRQAEATTLSEDDVEKLKLAEAQLEEASRGMSAEEFLADEPIPFTPATPPTVDDILKEPWVFYSYEGERKGGQHQASLCDSLDGDHEHCFGKLYGASEAEAVLRAKVASLAKQALDLVLTHKSNSCFVCGHYGPSEHHSQTCRGLTLLNAIADLRQPEIDREIEEAADD